MRFSVFPILLGFGALVAPLAAHGTPYQLSFGGRLIESDGQPIKGPVDIGIRFFRSATGNDEVTGLSTPVFSSTSLQDGVFQVTIALPLNEFHTLFTPTDEVWIEVTDISHNRTYPRQKFSAAPYALKVPVDNKSITFNTNGQLRIGTSDGNAGQVLTSDGAGNVSWTTPAGTGDLLSTANLSDLSNVATARSNLGLGDSATRNVGTAAGTVAAGDHTHTGYLSASNNLSDVTNVTTARTNLGLGDSATRNVGTAAGTVAAGDHTHTAANISNLDAAIAANAAVTANTAKNSYPAADATKVGHLTVTQAVDLDAMKSAVNSHATSISGLGTAATKNVGTNAGDVAEGNHTHSDATTMASGFMSAADKVRLNAAVVTTDTGTVSSTMIADGTITNDDVHATAAIAGSKVNPDFGTQDVVTTGTVAGSMVIPGTSPTICSSTVAGAIKYDATTKSLMTCRDVTGSGTWEFAPMTATITSDINITVTAGSCASIIDTLAMLEGYVIKRSATVTINIPDGTYNCGTRIAFYHVHGLQIVIMGNEASPSSVVLNFTNTAQDGIAVFNTTLGWLDGVTITGPGATATKNGIMAYNATIGLGPNIRINGWKQGIAGYHNSVIRVDDPSAGNYVTITDCEFGVTMESSQFYGSYTRVTGRGTASGVGFQAKRNSTLDIPYSRANAFNIGINTIDSSHTAAYQSQVTSNHRGIRAINGSSVYAEGAQASNNINKGFDAAYSSYIAAWDSTSTNNGTGYSGWVGGFISITGHTASGNSTAYTPDRNTVGNGGSYIED